MTHRVRGTDLVSLTLGQTPVYTTRQAFEASVSCGVSVYSSAFTGTHCTYARRDGQAEFTLLQTEILYPSADDHPSTV